MIVSIAQWIANLFVRPPPAVALTSPTDVDALTLSIACYCYGCEQQRKAQK